MIIGEEGGKRGLNSNGNNTIKIKSIKMQIPELLLRSTESETLEVGASNLCSSNSNVCQRWCSKELEFTSSG